MDGFVDNVVRFGPLRIWAERGIIHQEDSRDNSYGSMSIRTALHRVSGLSDMLGNSSSRQMHSEDQFDRVNRTRIQNMINAMILVIRRAQEQGSPDDAGARRELVRRRPKTVLVPGINSSM